MNPNDAPNLSAGPHPFLDAVALVNAQRLRDGESIHRLIDETPDLLGLVTVLAQMVQTAVRTQGMTVEEFLDMQTEATLEAIQTDIATGEIEDPWNA